MIKFREYNEGDESHIFALWKKIFGNLLEKNDIFEIDRKWWNWRIKKNPEGFPKIFLGISNENKIVTHLMIEKFKSQSGKRIYLSSLMMSDKSYKGLVMLKIISDVTKNIINENAIGYGLPNSNSLAIYEKFDWKNVGDIPVLVRPLNLFFRIFDISFKKENKKYAIEIVKKFDKRINIFVDSLKDKFPYSLKRDYNILNWKYNSNPLKSYEKRIVTKDNKIMGYSVFRCAKISGIKTGIILDILANDKEGLNILIDDIVRYFSEKKMTIISCFMIKNSFFYETLKNRGFICVPRLILPKRNALVILNKNGEKSIFDIKNWYVSYGDWDCF